MNISPCAKSYHNRTVLDFPGFELPDGQVCAVIGANGSGKSTLARIVAGTLSPDAGTSVINRDLSVGYMPQRSYPFQMTVMNNVLLNGGKTQADRQRAVRLLERLEIAHLAQQKAHHLSGGETARMALARLLMRDYGLLVLDEPTAAMDIQSTVLAEQLVADYQARTGCAVLWITHSLKQAQRVAQTVLFLCRGRLIEAGPAKQLLTEPRQPELKHFLEFYSL